MFVKPLTTTTRQRKKNEPEDAYRFVSMKRFLKEKDEGKFIETTVYSKNYYGTSEDQIVHIVESGKIAVIPIDICGALTFKNVYRSRAVLVFTNREKKSILANILNRSVSDDDKIRRLMSLDLELRNIELCDFAVRYDDGVDACVEAIKNELHIGGGAKRV